MRSIFIDLFIAIFLQTPGGFALRSDAELFAAQAFRLAP
jgi:hypothetical protein